MVVPRFSRVLCIRGVYIPAHFFIGSAVPTRQCTSSIPLCTWRTIAMPNTLTFNGVCVCVHVGGGGGGCYLNYISPFMHGWGCKLHMTVQVSKAHHSYTVVTSSSK